MNEQKKDSSVNLFTILRSAFSGLIGIQKKENLERDFASGRFWHFFIAGAIVTVLFMLAVGFAVKTMLASQGG